MAKAAVAKKSVARTTAKPIKSAKSAATPSLKVVTPAKKKTPIAAKSAAKPAVKKPQPASAQRKAAPAVKTSAKPASMATKKPAIKPAPKADFKVGDYVVYPTHGVGRIMAQETQNIGDITLRMLVIAFDKDRMTLRVPVQRAATAGLRHVSGSDQMTKVFTTLKSKAKTSRGMWSRRAQEYETKINSGNIIAIAEVVRDLHYNVDQAERSYSERMIYESALSRLVGELAATQGSDYKSANDQMLKLLRAKPAPTAAAA